MAQHQIILRATETELRNTAATYGLSALLVLSIVPYTLTVMKSTNGPLHEMAAKWYKSDSEISTSQDQEVDSLLGKWKVQNYGRASLVALGCLTAVLAPLNRR